MAGIRLQKQLAMKGLKKAANGAKLLNPVQKVKASLMNTNKKAGIGLRAVIRNGLR